MILKQNYLKCKLNLFYIYSIKMGRECSQNEENKNTFKIIKNKHTGKRMPSCRCENDLECILEGYVSR